MRNVQIVRRDGSALGNPFQIPHEAGPLDSPEEQRYRREVVEAHAEWLRLRDVPAGRVVATDEGPATILKAGGAPFDVRIAPRTAWWKQLRGREAVEAVRQELNEMGDKTILRLVCSRGCGQGRMCHGGNLAVEARQLVASRDARAAAAGDPPKAPRKTRSDAGVPRGPRAAKGGVGRMGRLSLLRYQHGIERQVPEALRAEVAAAEAAGYAPWQPPRAAGDAEGDREPSDDPMARATCEGACDGGALGGEACGDDAEARDVAEASRDERDLTLQEVVRAVDGAVEAASAAAFAAGATAEAGSSAQGEGKPSTPRGWRAGSHGRRRERAAADAREAAARLDEELEAGEYVTEFVDLSEEESSGEDDGAGGGGGDGAEGRESGGGRRKRARGQRATGDQREAKRRAPGR